MRTSRLSLRGLGLLLMLALFSPRGLESVLRQRIPTSRVSGACESVIANLKIYHTVFIPLHDILSKVTGSTFCKADCYNLSVVQNHLLPLTRFLSIKYHVSLAVFSASMFWAYCLIVALNFSHKILNNSFVRLGEISEFSRCERYS